MINEITLQNTKDGIQMTIEGPMGREVTVPWEGPRFDTAAEYVAYIKKTQPKSTRVSFV